MASIEKGMQLDVPPAKPGEQVDILSFVVTKAGWEVLKDRLRLKPSNQIRILTRLIYPSAISLITQAHGEWRWLRTNHAKVILYRQQRLAVLGSFNLTGPSLSDNIECLARVDEDFNRLAKVFEEYWSTAMQDDAAIVRNQGALLQALSTSFGPLEDELPNQPIVSDPTELLEDWQKPFPYQQTIIDQVMAWIDERGDVALGRIVTLPTGAGKTLVAAEVIRKFLEKRPLARVLWVCHRIEVLRQSWERTEAQLQGSIPIFVPQHVEHDDRPRNPEEFGRSSECQLVFCTRGMLAYLRRYNRQTGFDLIIVDECHHFHPESKTYQALYRYCNDRRIPRLGLTATPLASDKLRFGMYWYTEAMYGQEHTVESLIEQKYLSKICRDLTKPWPTGYTFRFYKGPKHRQNELLERIRDFDNLRVNEAVKRAWMEYRHKRNRVLCFAVTCEHADTLKNRYFSADDSVRVLHSKIEPPTTNRRTLNWFKESTSDSRMLISVQMLAEGVDLPQTDCLFMVRPTFSPELHQQMIGRGLRGLKAGGTEDCAIVDFTYQFVDRTGELSQVTTRVDGTGSVESILLEEDPDLDDFDGSAEIVTVGALRQRVASLRENGTTIQAACEELADELDYAPSTLLNYLSTKPDDYELGCADPQSEGGEGYITSGKLLDLRSLDPDQFEKIARLTDVVASTLRSYCSDSDNFRRWKLNNKNRMGQVRDILSKVFLGNQDAA